MAITLTNALIRRFLATKGHRPALGRLHLLGLRGCVPHEGTSVRLVENVPDRHNDTIAVFGTHLKLFLGTVDPGRTYTVKPLNPAGCAHLVNGVYEYKVGPHRGHTALVQDGGVDIWRDGDRDHLRDPNELLLKNQWIGLNIHAGSPTEAVGPYSAGCQNIAGGWDGDPWRQFIGLCQESNQSRFRYFLYDARELAQMVDGS